MIESQTTFLAFWLYLAITNAYIYVINHNQSYRELTAVLLFKTTKI